MKNNIRVYMNGGRFFVIGICFTIIMAACTSNQTNSGENDYNLVVITQEPRFDYLTWKIDAANGTWYFEIEHLQTGETSTGFNSAIDREGNDWIANNCEGRREWRGWPNFGPDGFGHACRGGGGTSQWVDENFDPIEFQGQLQGEHLILESWNDNYKVRYHFFPNYAAIEVVEANELYAFLWEGPVAGEMNIDQQYYVLQDGEHREFAYGQGLGYLDPEFGRNFPSPFFYFLDEEARYIAYVGVKGQSEGGDEGWSQPNNMVIFSFGREDDDHALTGTDAISVFGFLDKEIGHSGISTFINDRLNNPF
jgi:hypothetical protein